MYFISALKGRNEWWRYLIVILITLFAYLVLGSIPLGIVMAVNTARGVPMDITTFMETYDTEAIGISQNTGLVLLLFPSVLAFFVLWGAIVWIHGKKTGSIASAEGKIRWPRLFTGSVVWLALMILAELYFAVTNPENYVFQFNPEAFYPMLLLALLLVPFQTWFEELLFRGYLMQGTGLLFRSRIAALLLTSVAFGLLHAYNPEVNEFGAFATMPYYIGFGIFAGILVILDNGIELALGVHAVNNVYSAVFVTYRSSVLKTPALWSLKKLDPWQVNIAFLVMVCVFIIIMSNVYSWNDWKRIFRAIPKKERV
jgi:membrane protease YdiL (CAAX protease family)